MKNKCAVTPIVEFFFSIKYIALSFYQVIVYNNFQTHRNSIYKHKITCINDTNSGKLLSHIVCWSWAIEKFSCGCKSTMPSDSFCNERIRWEWCWILNAKKTLRSSDSTSQLDHAEVTLSPWLPSSQWVLPSAERIWQANISLHKKKHGHLSPVSLCQSRNNPLSSPLGHYIRVVAS